MTGRKGIKKRTDPHTARDGIELLQGVRKLLEKEFIPTVRDQFGAYVNFRSRINPSRVLSLLLQCTHEEARSRARGSFVSAQQRSLWMLIDAVRLPDDALVITKSSPRGNEEVRLHTIYTII